MLPLRVPFEFLPIETLFSREPKLEQARLVHRHEGAIYIAEPGKLDQFLEFLDMKERFGS